MRRRQALDRFVPILSQLGDYDRDRLRGDLSAGLTVGVMLIPQGMAYALIAGLPLVYGLYASLVPLVVYAVFGTSRQLAVGPVALVSLLVAAGVAPLAGPDPELYVGLALLLAFLVGTVQFLLGVARFGFLVNFLSHPVLAGFTSAAALIIGLGQLRHLLGIPIASSHFVHEILFEAVRGFGALHFPTLAIGASSILLLVALRRSRRTLPGALIVVAIATAVTWAFGLADAGVQIVGPVPGGLPGPQALPFSLDAVRSLLPIAVAIALVGFMESIAVAKVYAARNRYAVDANQELIGLGLANLAGAFFRAFPTTGGFSRSAVNADAGARTNLAALFSAAIIGATLLFLTPLFTHLPNAVLAAVIIVAVSGLFEWRHALFLWRVDRRDFAMMLLTFGSTLGLGIEAGILIGVVASLVLVIHETSRPHTALMGRLPGSTTYRNVRRHPEAVVQEGIAVLRMDASLYFANVSFFQEKLAELERTDAPLRAVVLDAYPVNVIDSTAAHALKIIAEEYRRRGVGLYLAGVKGPVRDVLERSGAVEAIGRDHFFYEVHEAAEAALRQIAWDDAPASESASSELPTSAGK